MIPFSSPPTLDATTARKGKIQLAGDLGGTAASPSLKNVAKVFNVKDYGAVDDGVTDNTTAFNNAISAASSAGGGCVFVPHTTSSFYLTGTVSLASNVYLCGDGWGSIIKYALHSGIKINGISNSGISNLLLDCTSQGLSPTDNGLLIQDSSYIFVDRVRVQNAVGFGIFLNATSTNTCSDIWITRCYLNGKGNADVIGGGPANSTGAVIKNLYIYKNKVIQDQSVGAFYGGAIVVVCANQYKYEGNYAEGIVKLGIEQFLGHVTSTIIGNVVSIPAGGTQCSLGFSLQTGVTNTGHDIVVANNVVYDGIITVDNASAATSKVKGVSIVGNAVYAAPASVAGGTAGIFVNGMDGASVVGNSVHDSGGDGIWLNYTINSTVTGNTCNNGASYGIHESNNSSNNLYSGNNLYNNTAGAISTVTSPATESGVNPKVYSIPTGTEQVSFNTPTNSSTDHVWVGFNTDRAMFGYYNGNAVVQGGTSKGIQFIVNNASFGTSPAGVFDTSGRFGVGQSSPTAFLHLKAGTATANTAPLKFTAGVNLTTPEAGALEFDGTHFYGTVGTTRYQLDQQSTGGGGGITRSVNSISASTTAGATALTDYVYKCTATLTLTLPTAVGNTNRYTVKNTGGTTTIATTSAQTIDGSSSATISVANTSLDLISDGANWMVV